MRQGHPHNNHFLHHLFSMTLSRLFNNMEVQFRSRGVRVVIAYLSIPVEKAARHLYKSFLEPSEGSIQKTTISHHFAYDQRLNELENWVSEVPDLGNVSWFPLLLNVTSLAMPFLSVSPLSMVCLNTSCSKDWLDVESLLVSAKRTARYIL